MISVLLAQKYARMGFGRRVCPELSRGVTDPLAEPIRRRNLFLQGHAAPVGPQDQITPFHGEEAMWEALPGPRYLLGQGKQCEVAARGFARPRKVPGDRAGTLQPRPRAGASQSLKKQPKNSQPHAWAPVSSLPLQG